MCVTTDSFPLEWHSTNVDYIHSREILDCNCFVSSSRIEHSFFRLLNWSLCWLSRARSNKFLCHVYSFQTGARHVAIPELELDIICILSVPVKYAVLVYGSQNGFNNINKKMQSKFRRASRLIGLISRVCHSWSASGTTILTAVVVAQVKTILSILCLGILRI